MNERRDITTDNKQIQRIIKDYYEQLKANKLDNLKEMDAFLGIYKLPSLHHKERESLK